VQLIGIGVLAAAMYDTRLSAAQPTPILTDEQACKAYTRTCDQFLAAGIRIRTRARALAAMSPAE
jgi:hypothetical protein